MESPLRSDVVGAELSFKAAEASDRKSGRRMAEKS